VSFSGNVRGYLRMLPCPDYMVLKGTVVELDGGRVAAVQKPTRNQPACRCPGVASQVRVRLRAIESASSDDLPSLISGMFLVMDGTEAWSKYIPGIRA
jgi:hypothetical protein